MTTPILAGHTDWYCPSCLLEDRTTETRPHTQMHSCPKLGDLTVPMARKGVKARHVLHERGDYINGDKGITYDSDGRAIMSAWLERGDGSNDTAVYAPTASLTAGVT